MKNLKSVLALFLALCLMMCLAVPAFATAETPAETTSDEIIVPITPAEDEEEETTGAAEETTGTAEETTGVVDEHAGHDHSQETEEKEESTLTRVVRIILTVLEVIASIILIVIVLLQSGKEAGLSGALSGNSDSYLSKTGKGGMDKMLAKSTKWVALVWLVLTLVLSLI